MLVPFLVSVFLLSGNCEIVPISDPLNYEMIECVKNILQKYYRDPKEIVYMNQNVETDDLLESLHKLNVAAVFTKIPVYNENDIPVQRAAPYLSYVIVGSNIKEFINNLAFLSRGADWNPYARFLIVIKTLRRHDLRPVFDTLLTYHVNNVVIANGTSTTELYTYNPFENYGCGKYYTNITEFGKCLDVTADIYPVKVITGLRNCFFRVSVPHWPPYGIDPAKVEKGTKLTGTEQYIFHLFSKIEQFKYKFYYNYDPEAFSYITKNMSVSGPMVMLQNNLTDVMLGGLMLIPSRANVFFYISGHLDLVDEVRIMVKKAVETPPWMDMYLEFSPPVWALLILALVFYSVLLAMMLRKKDKTTIIMTLLDNLLSHGPSLRCRQGVKLVFIVWVWFAFLINSFYITSLMSLTTKPCLGYQIENEETLMAKRLVPCISEVMDRYRKTEATYGQIIAGVTNERPKNCEKLMMSIKSVGKSDRLFTITLYSIYLYHRQEIYNQYEISPVYSFAKPYAKVIYAMYLYKGFPMYERLHKLAIRIRETGLSEKSLNDHFYGQRLKYHFHSRGYLCRFAIPWRVYIAGLSLSSVTFVVELASKYKINQNSS